MNFKEWLFSEMPLSSYAKDFIHPIDDKEGFIDDRSQQVSHIGDKQPLIQTRFSKKDRAIISHPRTNKILENKLRNSGYNFNILFLESLPQTRKDYISYVLDFMKKNNLQVNNHITFVKNSTSGHLLTPWMILHTLGHAVTDFINEDISLKIYDLLMDLPEGKKRINIPGDNVGKKTYLGHIFAFKSIQDDTKVDHTVSGSELVHEFIAEYLWNNGKIRIKPPYNEDDIVVDVISDIESIISEVLDKCVGRIIIDYMNQDN